MPNQDIRLLLLMEEEEILLKVFPLKDNVYTEPNDVRLSEDRKRAVLESLIRTPEGRTRLAATMVAPLRTRRDYTSIARRTFLIDELSSGASPFYGNRD